MDEGTYDDEINFKAFQVTKFQPHIWHVGGCGCGANTLALLTGKNPKTIRTRPDWTNEYMVWALRRSGFKIAMLTKRGLTNQTYLTHPIARDHVVLASIRIIKGEASWVVIHNHMMYHNFDLTAFDGYELINHPIVTAYLIKHPRWG